MTMLFNALAILFFLSMLAFGVSVCVMMVRTHGRQMLAAFAGEPFAGFGAEATRPMAGFSPETRKHSHRSRVTCVTLERKDRRISFAEQEPELALAA